MRNDFALLAGSWLLTYLIHSSLLLTLAWLATSRLRGGARPPALREMIWKVALVGGLATATLQTGLEVQPLGGAISLTQPTSRGLDQPAALRSAELPARRSPTSGGIDVSGLMLAGPTARPAPVALTPAAPLAAAPVTAPNRASLDPLIVLLSVWAIVAGMLCLLYLAQRARAFRRIGPRVAVNHPGLLQMLDSLRAVAAVDRLIRLTTARGLTSPVALGADEIVLPEAALTDLEPEQQRSMLAHELAHLVRRDPAWLALACLIERALFLQPLNRLARTRLQDAAEFLCDDWAVRRTGSGVPLATCLVRVAEWVQGTPHPVPLAGMAERRSQLVSRIHRLIEGRPMPHAPRTLWLSAGAVALIGVTAMAAPAVTSHARPTVIESANAPETPPDAQGGAIALDGALDEFVADTGDSAVESSGTRALSETRISRMRRDARRAMVDARRAFSVAGMAPIPPTPMSPPMPALAPSAVAMGANMRAHSWRGLVGLTGARSWDVDRDRPRDTTSIAVPALISALKDQDVQVRRAAAQSLANLDDPRAVPALIAALKDDDAEVRTSAADGLGRLEDARATPGLVASLSDKNKDVRRAALSALQSLPGQVPVEAILTALNDGDTEVRQSAIGLATSRMEGDEGIKDSRLTSAILKLLGDPSADIRQEALSAVAELGLKEAPAAVIAMAKDRNPDVRQQVASTLGRIGAPNGVPTLRDLLSDENKDVRESAVSGLSDIRDRSALEALVGALKSADPTVRRAAAEALGQRED